MKIRTTLFLYILTAAPVFSQELKTVNYGGQSYSVETTEAYSGGEIQTVHIEEKENLFRLIDKMVKSEEITCYKKRTKGLPTSPPSSVNLAFATYEGYTACNDVTRQYVEVGIGDKSQFLIHQDEFDKIMKQYLNGKHLHLCQKFLYNIDMQVYPSIVFSTN